LKGLRPFKLPLISDLVLRRQNIKGESKRGLASKYIIGSFRGTSSLFRKNLPLPLVKGKGIKGIGL